MNRKKNTGEKSWAQVSLRFRVNCLCYSEEKQVLDVGGNAEHRGAQLYQLSAKQSRIWFVCGPDKLVAWVR